MSVYTMAEDKVRTVMMVPEEYRAALRTEANVRGIDMGDILVELIDANPQLRERVEEIRRRRSGENDQKKGGRK